MNIRTDLVSERQEMHTEEVDGAKSCDSEYEGIKINEVNIETARAAEVLQKPIGRYITLRFGDIQNMTDTVPLEGAIIKSLGRLLGRERSNVTVVGLGNTDITPDALGPLVADRILATRHIERKLSQIFGIEKLSKVSAITAGVIGKTGIEAAELVDAAIQKIKPDAVIAVDALAARRPERLCRTIQLSNTGITPGSGVHNARKSLDSDSIGVPVIAIGIPTVVEAATYRYDCAGNWADEKMMVTPKDIDVQIRKSAEIISSAINCFLQPELGADVIKALM